jgi:PAS domain S-box-containing protein
VTVADDRVDSLRQQAEEKLPDVEGEEMAALSPEEARRLLHELRVHQIELETQNEELRRARQEGEASRARYLDLYNLAPVGYLTVSEEDRILEANLTAASLLEEDGTALAGHWLLHYVFPDDEQMYYRRRQQLFATGEPQAWELRLVRPDGSAFWARLEGRLAYDAEHGAPVLRIAMSDITERKRAEAQKQAALEALRKSEERFSKAFTASPVILTLTRVGDGRLIEVNNAFEQHLGYHRDEVIGRTTLELGLWVNPADRDRLVPILRAERRLRDQEIEFRTRSGEIIGCIYSAELIELEDDAYALAVTEDITQRKRAEAELLRAERRYRSLFEDAPVMYVIARDQDGVPVVADCNELFLSQLGYSRDQVLERPLADFYTPQSRAELLPGGGYQRALNGSFVVEERQLVTRDGHVIDTLLHASPETDAIGRVCGMRAAYVDITARKRAEGEIRQLSQFLDTVIDNANVWLNVLDDETGVVIWNKAAEEISGYSREEIVGHSEIWKWLYPDEEYRNEVLATAAALIERGEEEQDVETIIRRKEGQTRTISWNSRGLVDEKGTPIGSIALGRDVTERKRAQEALEQRASQLALLNEIGGQVAALLDLDQVLNQAAQLVQERFGFHFVGLFTRVAAEDRLAMRAKAGPCAHLFAQDYTVSLDEGMVGWVGQHGETLLANDVAAEPRYINSSPDDLPTRSELTVPIRIGDDVVGVLDLQSPHLNAFAPGDVTTQETLAGQIAVAIHNARLYAQAEWRSRELNLLNRVIAASAVAAEAGIEPILDAVCRELALAFGVPQVSAAVYNADRTEATIVAEWLGPGRTSALGQVLPATGPASRHLIERQAPLVVEMDEAGRALPFVAHAAFQQSTSSLLLVPVVANGEVLGSLALDAGERRRFSPEEVSLAWRVAEQVSGVLARARLREQHRQLEEQFRQAQKLEAVGRLAGGIAHDFNNLLTVIHLSSRLLERKLHPQDPLRQHVQRILDAGQRAAGLTGQLLAFSRREIVEPRVLDLNQVIGNLDDMLRRIIGEDVELRTIPAEALWPVKIDPSQVDQVIVNLAVNARDAMPTGGKLTIETANVVLDEAYTARHLDVEPGEYVLLAVSDTGVGMSEEVKAHLFEPFFTTKEKGKGTGLGLATVHGIVKQNNSHIWVYSEPGRGTTFKIYLPRVRVDGGALARPLSPGAALAARGTETLLLVEDEDQVRDLIGDILTAQGYQILAANDGVEALQVAGRHVGPIHLLLSDVVMPRMSGRALADELRASHPEMRVLYTSGYTDNAIVHHGVLEEGTHFLSKPFDMETLAHKVRSVLDGMP